jgi:hypothetical protein
MIRDSESLIDSEPSSLNRDFKFESVPLAPGLGSDPGLS